MPPTTITRLTQPNLPDAERRVALRSFAVDNGWHPSDEILQYRDTGSFAAGHLLVEHGLDHTAVISFLLDGQPFDQLARNAQYTLLGLSYNNLVDWHLFPDKHGLLRVYNRAKPLRTEYVRLSDEADAYRAEAFDKVVGRRVNPNLPALDDALLGTVARWRRILASELDLANDTVALAELFNAIFFVRALEDDARNRELDIGATLLDMVVEQPGRSITEVLLGALQRAAAEPLPPALIDADALRVFAPLDNETCVELLGEFYNNRFAPYAFDFSLMSKHALSRIYERYISILRPGPVVQKSLFGSADTVIETQRKDLGEVYTPQYIARFFSRFLQENMTPAKFRSLRVIDPACGSGMFLRTLLEVQCDPARTRDVRATAKNAFDQISGFDIEPNATKAARLSLYLLHLVLTGGFPATDVNVQCIDAIGHFLEHQNLRFDAVIANPPYVRWEQIPEGLRKLTLNYLADDVAGKADLYLAFLKIGLENVDAGGYMLFVLPHTFLLSKNARAIRKRITEGFWIRHLVDLSAMQVFEAASSYPILLIAERKSEALAPSALITRCTGFVGEALQCALEERSESNAFYSVYPVEQEIFSDQEWRLLLPRDYQFAKQIEGLPKLGSLYDVKQGINSGGDQVFIRPTSDVPRQERSLYASLLKDRDMERWSVPNSSEFLIFYPFAKDKLLSEEEIKSKGPETWSYLESHYDSLSTRASVVRGDFPWWRPERPRTPSEIFRPKIVGPHLMLFPKFSVDAKGKYGVSRTVFISQVDDDVDWLWYLCGILNSSVGHWQIVTQSHKYSRGYARIEAATLKQFRLPDPTNQDPLLVAKLVRIAQDAASGKDVHSVLDSLVADAYGVDLDWIPTVATGA
ncbi:MAG: N-6 DNA methylase [Planctomycetaceae bacterium]